MECCNNTSPGGFFQTYIATRGSHPCAQIIILVLKLELTPHMN